MASVNGLAHRIPRTALALIAGSLMACTAEAPRRQLAADQVGSGPPFNPSLPILDHATVVGFWLTAVDTLPPQAVRTIREQFRRSNEAVQKYLEGSDVSMVTTVSDTLYIQLVDGRRRMVTLTGLDFPYGYIFIEPGYAEEFHTGIGEIEDLEAGIDSYFGFESDEPAPKHRIASLMDAAHRVPVQPAPRRSFPGFAPVCRPSWTTRVPFTKTYFTPTDTWCGFSKVARSAIVSGSKTTTSA